MIFHFEDNIPQVTHIEEYIIFARPNLKHYQPMRTLFSLCVGIILPISSLAQGWQSPQLPQAPQPALFTPSMTASPVLNGSPPPAQSFLNPNTTAVYENDRRMIEAEQTKGR